MTNIIYRFLLLGFTLTFLACENDLKDVEAIDRRVDNIDRYQNIRVTYSDSARIRVAISAPTMETHYSPTGPQEDRFPQGVAVEFFDDYGDPNSWLSAKKAISYPRKNLIVVRDSVALVSIAGDTLRTEELFWDSQSNEIYTQGAFRYSKQGERIYGYKFKSDQNFNNYSFEKMSGHLQPQLTE